MMLCAIAVSAYVACTNCVGTGSVYVPCSSCHGSGMVTIQASKTVFRSMAVKDVKAKVSKDVACRDCFRGAYKSDGKGTGKRRLTCPVCKGNKRLKKTPLTTARGK